MKLADVELYPITGVEGTYQQTDDPAGTIETILSNVIGFITIVAGLAFILYFIVGGLTWLTARDNQERLEQAKQMITNALVGLMIVVIAWALAGILQTLFGFKFLSPATIIQDWVP